MGDYLAGARFLWFLALAPWTAAVSKALDLPAVLDTVASVFAWIALAAWVATFVNMLITWWRWPLTSGT